MKNYTKPLFAMELFSVGQGAARDCSDIFPSEQITLNDIATCVWDWGNDTTVFVGGSTCTIDGESTGFACYNNPNENLYIFKSWLLS